MQVYAANICNMNPLNFDILLDKISLEKRKRIEKFRYFPDKYRGVLGEVLLRKILIDKYSLKNSNIMFEFNEYAKPFLKDQSLQFNISHSGDWVVLAIDDDLVGIDIENIKDINYEEILSNTLNYNEITYIQNSNFKLKTFYTLWTLKESYIKMIGKGMSIPLKSFTIQNCGESSWKSICDDYKCIANYKNYLLDNQSIVSVCSLKDAFPEEIQIKNLDYLLD